MALGVAAFLQVATTEAVAQPRTNKGYCARDGTNLMLVIDVTTEYDETDKQLLVRAVSEIFETLHGGERVIIRTITSSFSTSERLVDTCMPNCNASSVLGKLFGCSEGRIVSDTRKAKQEIIRALRGRLAGLTEQPRSDIVRTLAQIAREEASQGSRKVLYLFSDLIENSDDVTARLFFETENARLMRYFRKYNLIARLDGVEVRAFGVGRGSTRERIPLPVPQHEKLLQFWSLYFSEAKAASVEISQSIIEHGP